MWNKDKTKKGSSQETTRNDFQMAMRKPSRKKHFGQHIAYQLFYRNPNSPNRRAYQRSIYCSDTLIPTKDGKLITKRCRSRWCPICASIQTAKFIAGYAPQLNELDDLWFVTLTRPTVTADKLEEQINTFQERWRAITFDRYWKKNKPMGLRKMECTIRPNDNYHYHWHIIIQGKENAEWIYKKWLQLNPESSSAAQDVRPIKKGQYIELFKYFTKLMSKDSQGKRYIDFEKLDFILTTIKGRRIYQPFGGLKKVEENTEDDRRILGDDVPIDFLKVWRWMTYVGYVDEDTGEVITGDWLLPKWVKELTGEVDDKETVRPLM